MIRAVVDTNVLVSGMISSSGNEALVIFAIRQGIVQPCLSEDIIAEYIDVLARPKFGFPPDEIAALVDMLRAKGELFPNGNSPVASPDPSDTRFLNCAFAAQADFLVTGNKRHFPASPYGLNPSRGRKRAS